MVKKNNICKNKLEDISENKLEDIPNEDKCQHVWECLKDRTHNKGNGKGKYKAYKCRECGKFQRRY